MIITGALMKKTNKKIKSDAASSEANKRITGLDLLRGIAVILMVQQHTGFWFWNNQGSMASSMNDYTLMVIVNGLGGMAAPLFITLAGIGAALMLSAGASAKAMLKRGVVIILFGYLLNILTPAWFSPGSWYVLHLIGSGLIISPLLIKKSAKMLFAIAFLCIAASAALLTYYDLPRYFSNEQMAAFKNFYDILLLAFAAGNFPIFPWIALFTIGVICGRWIAAGELNNIFKASIGIFFLVIVLLAVKTGGFQFLYSPFGTRVFMVNLYMYPAYPVQFLLLSALSLLCVYLIMLMGRFSSGNIITLTGRVSLTMFMLHIIIIRNLMVATGFWKTFNAVETTLLQIAVLLVMLVLVKLWSRIDFRYGFEWLLRKAG